MKNPTDMKSMGSAFLKVCDGSCNGKCSACTLNFPSLLYSFLQLCFIHFVSFRLGACLTVLFTSPNNVRFFVTACVEQMLAITEFSHFVV